MMDLAMVVNCLSCCRLAAASGVAVGGNGWGEKKGDDKRSARDIGMYGMYSLRTSSSSSSKLPNTEMICDV